MNLPDTLSALDLEDVMAALGAPVDRTNIGRALTQHPIAGVSAPTRRGQAWRVPREALLDVVAAVLLRRWSRTAAPGGWQKGRLGDFRLPAARLLAQDRDLAKLVPERLRRTVRAEERQALAAAAERARRRQAEAEREARREERARAAEERRYVTAASAELYHRARWKALAAHERRWKAAEPGGVSFLDSPDYALFKERWPTPAWPVCVPGWWAPPADAIAAARKQTDGHLDGTTRGIPDVEHLLPAGVDVEKLWRREPANG